MPRSQRSLILGKLRLSSGANHLLCNKAADEIIECRRERDELLDLLAIMVDAEDQQGSDAMSYIAWAVDKMEAVLIKYGRKAKL